MNSNDPFVVEKTNYGEILKGLNKIRDIIIDSIGLNFDKSRFGTYRRHIERLWQDINGNKIGEFKASSEFETSITALVESIELISIFENLSISTDPNFVDKLKKILKGPILPKNENYNTNESRNTIFELNLGAHFNKAMQNVDFSTGDFITNYDGDKIIFECKRPFGTNSIIKNFQKAYSQLSKKLNAYSDSYGIIAISINRLLTGGELFPVVSSEDQLKIIMESSVQNFISSWEKEFIAKIINIRILGMFVHLLLPAVVEDQKIPFIAQFSGITNFCLNNSADFLKLRGLSMSLRPL